MLGVNGSKIGIPEYLQASLWFLKSDSWIPETKISLVVLSDLTDKTLESNLRIKSLVDFLVTSDLTKMTVPGLYLCRLYQSPVAGADLRVPP
jgi:hypothetical protein